MGRVNCLGVLVVDALSGPIGEYPVPKVRTQVNTQTIRFLPGGGAANTAAALGRMGLDAGVFSKVGADLTGEFLVHDLQRVGVDTSGVVMSEDETTPFTFVGIHADGDRTFIHTPGANLSFGVADIDLEALLSAEMLFYQDFWVKPAIDGVPGAELMAEAKRRGVVTLLDECWGLGPNRETFEMMLPHCDYVMPSLDDMRAIYGAEASAEEIAARLLGQGVGTVVVKMGAEGCMVAQGEDMTHVPALAAEVVDTTGAGDCWDAGFIAGLMEGEDLVTSARLGNACAAFCIEAVGGAAGVPSYDAVRARALADPRE
jgi:sugar/nucleoside kinase (ribokinase family)